MRTNLLCCLLALLVISLWTAQQQRPAPQDLRLKLILSRKPIQPVFVTGDCYSLELKDGLVRSERRRNGVLTPFSDIQLSPEEVARLSGQLRQAGAWDLSDVDSKEPESRVLYTLLEVREGDQESHTSYWRGLPPDSPQQGCAQVLCGTPFGAQLEGALETL